MDDDTVCCDWCGDEYPPEEMATAELCQECIHVADLGGDEDDPVNGRDG